MDERDETILLRSYQGKSVREIADEIQIAQSMVQVRLVRLRDNGYIQEWPRGIARAKRLTARGKDYLKARYGPLALEVER